MSFVSHAYLDALSVEERMTLLASHLPLGSHPDTNDLLLVPDRDRYAGTYVLGVQGVGKSALLENMIAFDNAVGNAVIVIDPHGDLTAHCLAELPAERVAKTYVLDMEDEAYPFGVNVFAAGPSGQPGKLTTSIQHAQAVERIMHIFEVLWEDVLSQQNLPRYVRAATITFLDNPGATLVDMHTFLLDDAFRARLLANVSDPTVTQFWHTQFEKLSEVEQTRRIQPLINRLESLFMGRSLIRNIVGQRQTSINFRTAIEQKELIFVKLPMKLVAQDARLIGTVIVAQLHAAIFSFADIPEAQRPGLSLYVDEFQHFSTTDFSELFTEGRKFGVKVTVAHQYRGQLPKYLQASTMTARTKICFQTTPEDGREMAHVFPAQSERIRPEDVEPHAVHHLLTYGAENPATHDFVECYLRPLQSQKRGNRVEISDTGFSVRDTAIDMMSGGATVGFKPRVPDPTPYLDNLLYQVMRTGNAHLPIPPEAMVGFANCGRYSFFQQARRGGTLNNLLRPQITFPPSLVADVGNGPQWTRPPEGGQEQFYHFLFCLRMMMRDLAEHPLGKASTPSTTAVGQMLTHLPRRAAFVRSGESVGVIYTTNTPRRLDGDEFQRRVQHIQAQTRQKYCHPRDAIEQTFLASSGVAIPDVAIPGVAHPESGSIASTIPSITEAIEGEIRLREQLRGQEGQQAEAADTPQRWEEVGDE